MKVLARCCALAAVFSFACSSGSSAPCLAGSTKCGSTCVNLAEDQLNCGACGTACTDTQRCSASACHEIAPCLTGSTACAGSCVNTQSDQANCGSCSHACGAAQRCVSGTCTDVPPTCIAGSTLCGSTCANLTEDQNNCGACSQACGADERCVSSHCTKVGCAAGLTDCDGGCADLTSDRDNCGACNTHCAELSEACDNSACFTKEWQVLNGFDGGLSYPSFSDFTPVGESAVYAGNGAFQSFTPPPDGIGGGAFTDLAMPDGGVTFGNYVGFGRHGGALYIFHGQSIYAYDIASNSWTTAVDNALAYSTGDAESTADEDGFVYSSAQDGGESALIRYNSNDGGLDYFVGSPDFTASEPRLAWDPHSHRLYLAAYDTSASGFYAWDPADGGFSLLAPMPDAGAMSDAFCADRLGHIFTSDANRDDSARDFWVYDEATDSWREMPDLPFPHGSSSTCTATADGWIYFGNGDTGQLARYRLR